MSRLTTPVLALALAALGLVACGPKPAAPADVPATPAGTVPAGAADTGVASSSTAGADAGASGTATSAGGGLLGAPSLEGLTLPSAYVPDGEIALVQGQAEEAAAPGSASTVLVRLAQQTAIDDFNGDGQMDIAVVLVSSPGGSGTFSDLHVVLGDNGQARPLPPVNLGDRIKLQSVFSQDGQIVVSYLTHGPDQAMAESPTQPVTRSFVVQGDQVVEVAGAGGASGAPPGSTPGAAGATPGAASATP